MITPTSIECPRCKAKAGERCGVRTRPHEAAELTWWPLDYHHAERVDAAMQGDVAWRPEAHPKKSDLPSLDRRKPCDERIAELSAALAEALDGWGHACTKTGEYDEKAFDRMHELRKLVTP